MNPRYYPQERQSPSDKRFERFSQLQEGQQRQQQLDQRSQEGMLQQLQQLYGIQQEQQMNPLRQAQMEAQTQAQQNQNRQADFDANWAQANAMRNDELGRAQIDAIKANTALAGRKEEPQLPHGFEYLPPEAQNAIIEQVYPVIAKQHQAAAATKNTTDWNDLEYQTKIHGLNPEDRPHLEGRWGTGALDYLQGLHPGGKVDASLNPPELAGDTDIYGLNQQLQQQTAQQNQQDAITNKATLKNKTMNRIRATMAYPKGHPANAGMFELPY